MEAEGFMHARAGSGSGRRCCWQPPLWPQQQSRRCSGPGGEPGSWRCWLPPAFWPSKVPILSPMALLICLPDKAPLLLLVPSNFWRKPNLRCLILSDGHQNLSPASDDR